MLKSTSLPLPLKIHLTNILFTPKYYNLLPTRHPFYGSVLVIELRVPNIGLLLQVNS